MPKSKNLAEITFRQLSDRANLRGQIITKSYRSSKQTSNQDLGIWVLSLSLQISCPKHSFLLVKQKTIKKYILKNLKVQKLLRFNFHRAINMIQTVSGQSISRIKQNLKTARKRLQRRLEESRNVSDLKLLSDKKLRELARWMTGSLFTFQLFKMAQITNSPSRPWMASRISSKTFPYLRTLSRRMTIRIKKD